LTRNRVWRAGGSSLRPVKNTSGATQRLTCSTVAFGQLPFFM